MVGPAHLSMLASEDLQKRVDSCQRVAMLSQLQGLASARLSITPDFCSTPLVRSVSFSGATHWQSATCSQYFLRKTVPNRLAPARLPIECSAFEQEVPLPSNQGVWKQPVTPHALQRSSNVKSSTAANVDSSAALSKAIEVLRDIEGLRGGQQNVSETVADVVGLLQGLQDAHLDSQASGPVAPDSESSQAPPHSEPPALEVPSAGGNNESKQSEVLPGDGPTSSTAIQVVRPIKAGASVTNFLRSVAQGVVNLLKTSTSKSVGGMLGGVLLAAVLGTLGANLPAKSPIPLPKFAPTISVPYNHFLSHLNHDVVDKVEMVGQEVLYKLRDDVVYNPGSYQPEQEVIQALLTGVASLLRLRKGGSLDDAMLKTTLPAGHTLPLGQLVDNNVTLKARQPRGAPPTAATILVSERKAVL